ncbi:MAG: efflux RND transporter periplasmic adaptor subunit [Cytophagales bacterium]|jgi:HlyD family secretion protein|nr:efflux RND transporter periplasmic adaptor subunit [Cytophagales bacterium]MCE2894961.1 efflux RND transporter periplasmic adaptor subunit [Flammeovirgaceae bacterium]MCA6365437.1 efflux RND transporter periplasmic adaptor subunit [Cytophagales bacterium]MCA6370303.1 efflux RND transporter periplasmic adaptor subunit [Cytophagales bacterium]MCA6376517.1 efflux RND transporter periplasmic adaptor subunit [Cytophagales bacterium]
MAKQKKKSNKLLYWGIGIVVFLIIFLVLGKSQGWIGKSRDLEVEFTKSKKTSITEKVSASGTVQPVIEVKLAPEVSGEIIELNVQDGDSVSTGKVLVKIRPDVWLSQLERSEALLSQQKANLESSRASLSRAEATFMRSEQDYKRQEKLWNEKVISEADWQLAQQNYKVAQNDLRSATQGLEAAKYVVNSSNATVRESAENVRRTTVYAPMKGIVSKLNVKKGERVVGTAQMTGTEMLRIADLNKMEVRVNVNENDIVRVHLNDTVLIDVDSYASTEKQFKGIVTNIANTARDKTSADAITEFEVRILILRSSYEDLIKQGNRFPFRPGMTASVEIITTKKDNVLSVPLTAVTTRNTEKDNKTEGGPPKDDDDEKPQVSDNKAKVEKKEDKVVVFVNDKGVAKMVEVKTGISDYDNIEIISGLADSVEVVTGPFLVVSKRLKDGDKIVQAMKKDDKKDDKK